ncbi:hypothetical protein CSC62_05310 [Pseudoxanthomonas jiangsuensis]|uniref:hypothetical protein n=1 Tax=Pseudoxanthomonas jiangsuensis TaxID=619688 RepID=UPI00139095E8|nr:hypothetical protein [Pseudoxanthomonas jiangsuensis]KAF1698328.1 hypothetical protein CSC62_05310 [Pseudoxanthomonas jiangsuensis]
MSTQTKAGSEPAYPVPNDANVNGQEGLTKRELFAAMAMQGLASVPADGGLRPEWIATDAQNAVAYADALLAELEKQA